MTCFGEFAWLQFKTTIAVSKTYPNFEPFISIFSMFQYQAITVWIFNTDVKIVNIVALKLWSQMGFVSEYYSHYMYVYQINTTYTLDDTLEASACLLVAVRGYNRAMLYSTSYKELIGCTVPDRFDLRVMDAVGQQQADGSIGLDAL